MKQDTRTNQHYDELHLQIQDMLAGYVDNALEEQEQQIVEAHLAGCDDCRRDVARQQLLAKRLQDIPGSRLSAQAHQKLDQLFDDDLSQGLASSRTKQIKSPWFYPAGLFSPAKATLAVGGLVMLLMLVTSLLLPSWKKPNSSVVPMVQDVVTEYRQLSHTQLPITSARNQQMPPATWQNARVIANWKTNIGGAPAEAFAVRYGNNIVFQYKVDEAVFFNNAQVRLAVSSKGNYQLKQNDLEVLALPLKKAGLLMVAPRNEMPKPEDLVITSI